MPYSSGAIIRALESRGFEQSKGTGHKGTHRTWFRRREGAPSQTVTVVLGQREIPMGTIRSYARQLGVSVDELLSWLS